MYTHSLEIISCPRFLLSFASYLMNFLLDATVGMLVIWLGVKLVAKAVEYNQWTLLTFGEYGEFQQKMTRWKTEAKM